MFMRGPAPIWRAVNYLKASKFIANDSMKVMGVHYILHNRKYQTREEMKQDYSHGEKKAEVGLLLAKDETCFLAYHPDKEHPYKDTRPVPKKSHAEESILKVDSRHMITKSPNLEQLQTLTYTPRRYWIPFPGKAKRKKMIEYYNDNVDRPGLTS